MRSFHILASATAALAFASLVGCGGSAGNAPSDPGAMSPASDPAAPTSSAATGADLGSTPAPTSSGSSSSGSSSSGSSSSGSSSSGAPASSTTRVVGYWGTWTATTMPPSQIQWSGLTHVAQAFVTPAANGGLSDATTYANPALVNEAHAHGVKVIVSVGGASANFDGNTDPAARAKTVSELATLVSTYGYDGVDVDWEFPTAATANAWASLLTELRTALNAINPQLSLSAATSPTAERLAVLPKSGLDALTWVGMMTYDFAGPWSSSVGHDAPLFDSTGGDGGSVSTAVDYMTTTMGQPASKVLFGVPFYGYQFGGTSLGAKPGAAKDLTYTDIAPMIGKGWTRGWDDTAKVPYLTADDGSGFITYDDAQSISNKCAWAKTKGLGGAIVWQIAGDRMSDGSDPLMTATQGCR